MHTPSKSHKHTHMHTCTSNTMDLHLLDCSREHICLWFLHLVCTVCTFPLSYSVGNLICSGAKPPNKLSKQNGKHLCRVSLMKDQLTDQLPLPDTSQNLLECLWTLPEETQMTQTNILMSQSLFSTYNECRLIKSPGVTCICL